MDLKNSRTIVLNDGNEEEKRQEILHYFHKTFDLDDQLYDHLAREEAFYLRADPLRHPLVFYFGHTATFYLNKLNVARLIDQRINPSYESMFAIGVDEMSWDDLNEQNYDWPTVDEVRAYRKKVRAFVAGVIEELPLSMPITLDSPFWVIVMGIEHQRIHIETSSVIIRRLPLEEVRPLTGWDICPFQGKALKNSLLPVAGGGLSSVRPKIIPCMAGIMSLANISLRYGTLRLQSTWSQMENFCHLLKIMVKTRSNTGRKKGGNGLRSARRNIPFSG
jgi:hypothetical protein